MPHIYEQTLIDFLDNQLKGEERLKAEQLISEDATAATELENLQFTVALIREAGVAQEVASVRAVYSAQAKVVPMHKQEESGAVVRSMFKNVLRIAVMLMLVVGAATAYKYSTVNSTSVYNNNFTSFDLNTTRGGNSDGEMEKSYRNKDWSAVKNNFKNLSARPPKVWFLAGMAEMETKNYEVAIGNFKEVLKVNENASEQYYQDEAEYYLAMSYIAAGQSKEGVAILRKIKADKTHLFNNKASEISALDLKMLEWHGTK